ncbi:MAG: lysophospholipid acyltransferase family protein [Magnetococcales bacterium]|nr:lysophospholipid acyltransferase family protein [Magnetococcales bacterium]
MSPEPVPRLKHRFEWLLLQGLLGLVRAGDLTSAYRRVRRLAALGRRLFTSEWAWTHANLAMIYGDHLTPEQREKLATLAFENIFFSYMESIRVHEIAFRDEGVERLHAVHGLGRGAIIVAVHVGSWEPGLKRLGGHVSPTAILYRHANNPLSEKTFMELRAGYGVAFISRQNTREIVRAMQERKVMGFMTDINTREGGVTASFLGVPAQCPPGPARLALKFNTPILPIIATRAGWGEAVFRVGEPIEPQAGGASEERVVALTEAINAAFVPWVHEYAEQYNWLHARWRARPDGSLWRPEQAARANPTPAHPSERVLRLLDGCEGGGVSMVG